MSSSEGGASTGAGEPKNAPVIPNPIYNWMSVIGSVVAAASVTVTIFLVVIGLLTRDESGYSGLLLLFPMMFGALGFALVATGYIRERWRQGHGRHSSFFERTVVDPWSYVSTRGLIVILAVVIGGTFAVLAAGGGSVAVVGYSESNEFCGEIVPRRDGSGVHGLRAVAPRPDRLCGVSRGSGWRLVPAGEDRWIEAALGRRH